MSTQISSTLSEGVEDQNSSATKYTPVDIDGNRILWYGNPAYLDGAIYECKLFYQRTGLFESLFEHGASLLSNGRLAVDSAQAIDFASGLAKDFGFGGAKPPRR